MTVYPTLREGVEAGTLQQDTVDTIQEYINRGKNIIIVGKIKSGKTHMLKAVVKEVTEADTLDDALLLDNEGDWLGHLAVSAHSVEGGPKLSLNGYNRVILNHADSGNVEVLEEAFKEGLPVVLTTQLDISLIAKEYRSITVAEHLASLGVNLDEETVSKVTDNTLVLYCSLNNYDGKHHVCYSKNPQTL